MGRARRKNRYIWTGPYEFDIESIFSGTSITVRKELETNMDQCYSTDGQFWFKHSFELEPIYEKKVFLVVEGRNIEIDKNTLSKNSTYFADLLNSDRTEFPIENVICSEMKQILRILDSEPQVPNVFRFPAILQLAENFKIPSVRLFIEFYLMLYDEMPLKEKIEMADKFGMNNLWNNFAML
ncbi:hypothetical protein L5515_002052 [Caenorhabditis briggsae]|uniref:BTB domain-containing protein n=1 Tax=Caenorhabditis briggsae TaxID=6238 RepID=A0AAE9J4M1_CAEBR|nr:hypothetical protein L5515_002052 [Caenorhabditis briggsae]